MTKICIIAGNYQEALTFAKGQQIPAECWFYPTTVEDLMKEFNFHVLVVGTAGTNVPPAYFEKVYQLAQTRGRIGRK